MAWTRQKIGLVFKNTKGDALAWIWPVDGGWRSQIAGSAALNPHKDEAHARAYVERAVPKERI